MDENLFVWDPNMRGIMIKYLNLKLEKKLVEVIEEQTNVNIPIKYEAIYFIPEIGCDVCKIRIKFLDGEVVQVEKEFVRLNVLGVIQAIVDLDKTEKNNFNVSTDNKNQKILTFSHAKKNYTLSKGNIVQVKLLEKFVKSDRSLILSCEFDFSKSQIILN